MTHGILQQVGDHLMDAFGVPVRSEVMVVDAHVDRDARVVELLFSDGVREHGFHGEGVPVQRDGARFEPREVQELGDQPTQPLDLVQHRLEGRGIRRCDAVDQVLERGLERRERSAEFVTDVRHQISAHAIGLGELGGHPVECGCEPPHFVVGCSRDDLRIVALGHGLGRRRHLAQG